MNYAYPTYGIDLTHAMMRECGDLAARLLHEVGLQVPHARFLALLEARPGIRILGDRVHFEPSLSRRYLEQFISGQMPSASTRQREKAKAQTWQVRTAGFSMMVLDIETEEIRPATRQDLRDLIKLVNSCGVGGSYPVMPQDLPPLMQAIACFKICWEMSENIAPFDYQQPEQTRYIYEMHRVMGKPFEITLCVPTVLTLDPKDVGILLDFHPDFKKNRDIEFGSLSYPMVGITKPITFPGCLTLMLAEKLGVHMLFNLFDPDIPCRSTSRAGIRRTSGTPVGLSAPQGPISSDG